MEILPEKIEGIPTAKKLSKERVALIKKYYTKLWKNGDGPIYDKPKSNTQKANGYKNMVVLHHKFTNETNPYLNFMAKLTIGIKADGKHVQYCVNKVECTK